MELLKFRDAQPEDLDVIINIYNSTIPSRMATADTEAISTASRQQWFSEHSPNKRPLWIVENKEDQVIGWISFQSFYGRPAYYSTAEISIYLKQEYQHKGYGKSILEYAINHASALGIKTLLGFIFAHNKPSLKLFRQFGFEEWAHLPDVAIIDGQERSLKIMGKRLN